MCVAIELGKFNIGLNEEFVVVVVGCDIAKDMVLFTDEVISVFATETAGLGNCENAEPVILNFLIVCSLSFLKRLKLLGLDKWSNKWRPLLR